MTSTIALVGGALAGSAAGAALQRWPSGGTLLRPARSRCPSCAQVLRARHLVPVVSWLLLRGRCATCDAPIDARLPLLEGASALVVLGVIRIHGLGPQGILLALGAVAVLLAALGDVERLRIPDRLTLPLAACGLLGLLALRPGPLLVDLAWALGVPMLLLCVSLVLELAGRRRPLGRGDLKLLVGVLALAGLVDHGPAAVLLLAVLLGGSVAAAGLALGHLRRGDVLPLAPWIAVAYLTVVLVPAAAPWIAGLTLAAAPSSGGPR